MSVIVGISAHYHDSACAIIKDGVLVAAAEEERFTKKKHDAGIPANAFRYCLRQAGVSLADVTRLAYYEEPIKKASRQIWAGWPDLLTNPKRRFRIDSSRAEAEIRQALGYDGTIDFMDHHLSHAASAFLFSGFEQANILTVDGVGEWATTSYGLGDGVEIELFEEVSFPHSLGLLYSAITAYLGFDVNDAEYKVMGLAPYGQPRYLEQLRRLIHSDGDGQYRLDLDYFEFLNGERMYSDKLCTLLGEAPRRPESELSQFHNDVAHSIQAVLEEILLQKVRYLHRRRPSENLCMAGGVALNCVANGRIHREGPFANLFVQPAASDAGGALGAAALAHVRHSGRRLSGTPLRHVFLGPSFSNREVRQIVVQTPLRRSSTDYSGRLPELLRATAERLADGKVVGWCQGRMEFGPRALGGRSILADPRGPQMRDRINALVKMREAFRPFAPAVLESKMAEHFDLSYPSPFMLETCRVISPIALPAITHVDQSARVQTVTAETNPRFFALLEEFDLLTGCPILLNTSFNLRGDPIVLDPIDAIWTFAICDIDTLVLEDHVIDRPAPSATWKELARALGARRAKGRAGADPVNVYSFL
jgi:carbamoyltransferase